MNVPINLEECVSQLKLTISEKDQIEIIQMSEESIIAMHHGLGLWIRNHWIHNSEISQLRQFFKNIDIVHPDDISSLITKALWADLKNLPFDLDVEAEHYRAFWRTGKAE